MSALRRYKPYPAYKDSGVEWLGKIPAHWDVKRLKRVFRVVNGSTPASGEPEFWNGDIPWVTPEDLGDLSGKTIESTRRHITNSGYRSCGTTLVPAGSLVLSTRAPIVLVQREHDTRCAALRTEVDPQAQARRFRRASRAASRRWSRVAQISLSRPASLSAGVTHPIAL